MSESRAIVRLRPEELVALRARGATHGVGGGEPEPVSVPEPPFGFDLEHGEGDDCAAGIAD